MTVEIEAKMRVTDHEGLERTLTDSGGQFVVELLEENLFFDTSDRRLLTGDRGLRVRVERTVGGPAASEARVTVTYKGPRAHGKLKSRQEIEFEASDVGAISALLTELGYEQLIRFQKRRRRWQLGTCLVELDELPYLGRYVEIEGPSDEAVLEARRQLNLEHETLIRNSYTALLAAHLEERGVKTKTITFESASA